MKLWNLETFKAVGSTDLGSGPILMTKFLPEAKCLLSASADQARLYPVANLQAHPEVFETDWGPSLKDLQVSNGNKLLGISTDDSVVNVWVGKVERKGEKEGRRRGQRVRLGGAGGGASGLL